MKSLLTGILILGSSLAFAHEAPNDVAVDAAKDKVVEVAKDKAMDAAKDKAGEVVKDQAGAALGGKTGVQFEKSITAEDYLPMIRAMGARGDVN